MGKKKNGNIELDGLRQGPAKETNRPLQSNEMACILMKLFPDYVLPKSQCHLKDNQGNVVKTKSGHGAQPDFVLDNRNILIEVDGQNRWNGHYTCAKTCIEDLEKDETYRKYGWTVVRIPAYVQLDKEMVKFYFGVDYCEDLYPACHLHGFLHDGISLPADFCHLGLERFYKEMDSLPNAVRNKILDTLKERIDGFQKGGYDSHSARLMVLPENFKYDI